MSTRQKRIDRVKSVRQDALDRAQAAFGRATQELMSAKDELVLANARVEQARDERLRSSGNFNVDDWHANEAWLKELGRRRDEQLERVHGLELSLEEARAHVTAAKTAVEQMSTLLDQVRREEDKAENVRERKDDDDIASGRWIAAKNAQ